MIRYMSALVVCAFAVFQSLAQDPKWEPPAAPEGWKAVVSKDGIYRFFVPQQVGRSGTRDNTMTVRGLRLRSQVNYFNLKSGQTLTIEVATLSGTGTRGLTEANALDNMLDVLKGEGYKIGDLKEAKVGTISA